MADSNQRYAAIIKNLKGHRYKLTPQRLAIVKLLALSDGHPSVEQIHRKLHKKFPTMSLTTVYRNVMLLKSLNEVLELGFPDGSNRYDGNKPFPHPHIVCVQCKKIIDPDLSTLSNITLEVARETGFKIVTHRLDFFGICQACQEEG